MTGNTQLFGDRSDFYVKGRPGYPAGVIGILQTHCGLVSQSVVADVGAGTGIFTELLARTGCTVYCVEPNDNMRRCAGSSLKGFDNCRFVAATAEATTLTANSIHIVTVAHALHWFDIPATKREFSRILRPHGWVVIVQNSGGGTTDFERECVKLKKLHSRKKGKHVGETYASKQEAIATLYGHAAWQECKIAHQHDMDWDTLVARMLSNSAVPIEGEPGFEELMAGLRDLFRKYQQEGYVTFNYEAKVRWGNILCAESPTSGCTGAADAAR